MNVAGIDAHATYLVVQVVSRTGELVQRPVRIANQDASKLLELLARFRPLEAVVETSPAWPWLHDLLTGHGHGFVLAHAKRLRIIAESNDKRDEIDAELLARMRLAGLIPYVHAKAIETREQATLIRHRERLTRLRTGAAGRIHAKLHSVGLHLGRGRLLTRAGRQWVREHAWPLLGPEQQRLGWQTARVAAARKLARATHAMLGTGETWRDESDSPSGERRELQRPHVAPTTSVS